MKDGLRCARHMEGWNYRMRNLCDYHSVTSPPDDQKDES